MTQSIIDEIVQLWSDINPVASYTSGYTPSINNLVFQTKASVAALIQRINDLQARVSEITDPDLRATASAILVNQQTQLELARPSGAGPSGTGAGGVYAAADGVFYVVLKGDFSLDWVSSYLNLVTETVLFETQRWAKGEYTVEVRKECLNTVTYMRGALSALTAANPTLEKAATRVCTALNGYQALFYSADIASNDFDVVWAAFKAGDAQQGPQVAQGYPATLQNYYTLDATADQVEQAANDWMLIDMPVTLDLAQRIGAALSLPANATLQTVWDSLSQQ